MTSENIERNDTVQLTESERKQVMEAAMRAGKILLSNGAEISRVEETIDRICHHYGIGSANSFVLSNGIFMTMGGRREEFFAKVQHLPADPRNYRVLDRIPCGDRESCESPGNRIYGIQTGQRDRSGNHFCV